MGIERRSLSCRFTEAHGFEKPNDQNALQLMNKVIELKGTQQIGGHGNLEVNGRLRVGNWRE